MKENIGIIIYTLNGGGAERCVSNLSLALSKKYNVFLIVFDGKNITYPYAGTLIDLHSHGISNNAGRILNTIRRTLAVRKIKRDYNFSCTISLLDGPNIVNVLSKVNDRTVVSIRNKLSSEYVGYLRRKTIIYSSMNADLTVCLSKMVEKDMHEVFGIPYEKLTTIYNHCDAQLLHSLVENETKPEFIDSKKAYFVTMGRLTHQKGQWHLIRAFKRVVEEIPEARLIIMGEGELEEKLKKLSENLSIADKVIFTGYIKNPHNILKCSEIFVFTSLYEGLGNVLLEALAFEMPIISVDCIAGPREILAPNTDLNTVISEVEYAEYGILVPVMDDGHFECETDLTPEEEILAKTMIDVHKDSAIRENYHNKSAIGIQKFSAENIIAQWIKEISK